jgi:hypothetical protein
MLMSLSAPMFIAASDKPEITMEQSAQLKNATNITRDNYDKLTTPEKRELLIRTMIKNPSKMTDLDRHVIHAGKDKRGGFGEHYFTLDNHYVEVGPLCTDIGIIGSNDPLSPLKK